MIKYKGFSTVNNTRKTKLTDFELAKQDLINHFHIRKGEKLHNPNFGSNLWSVVFDPLTTSSKQGRDQTDTLRMMFDQSDQSLTAL